MDDKIKAVIVFLGGIIAVILLGLVVFKVINSSNGDPITGAGLVKSQSTTAANSVDLDLEKQIKTSSAELSVRGPVVAREDHYQIEMTINATRRTIKVHKGYNSQPISEQTFSNDENAYKEFLYAAKNKGMFVDDATDTSKFGYCSSGQVRTYQLTGNASDVSSWANSCDSAGDISTDRDLYKLFTEQFPNYKTLTEQASI